MEKTTQGFLKKKVKDVFLDRSILEETIKNGLGREAPYFEKGKPQDSIHSYIEQNPHKPASVLICLSCPEIVTKIENIEILYTVRTDDMPSHKGQISFPGGKQSKGESTLECAIRETYEEVGIEGGSLSIIGCMPIYPSLISRFFITPVIAYFKKPFNLKNVKVNPREVSEVFRVPISALIDEDHFVKTERTFEGISYPLYEFFYNDYRIWGITAHLTFNFLSRLGLFK